MNISYDKIAADYAAHRSVHPEMLLRLIEFPRLTSGSQVLEVGCGTGNYISAIASAVSARCFGLEPSSAMLESALKKTTAVSWSRGSAEALPYPEGTFDLVFSVDVIHHVQDRPAYFREAFRVLKRGGWFATGTDSEQIIHQRMPLSHYFPETVGAELKRYPKDGEIRQLLAAQHFGNVSEKLVEFAYLLSDATAFERKAFSSLHLISEDAFNRGLNRMKEDLKKSPISCSSKYVTYWGQKI